MKVTDVVANPKIIFFTLNPSYFDFVNKDFCALLFS